MVLAAVAPDHEVGVVGGCGHHAEDIPRGGFNGDDAANLAFEEAFAECLEVDVDAEGEVLAGDGPLVERAVLVASLDTSVGIAQEDFDALLAAEFLLIGTLDALDADEVAAAVVVVVLDVAPGDLRHVAQHVRRHVVGVLPGGAPLDVESGEAEELLLEDGELLGRQLAEEDLFGVGGIAGIDGAVLDVLHPLAEELGGDVERTAEVERVEVLDLAHDYGHVVGRLVVDHETPLAVVDGSPCRVLHLVEEGVAVGVLLVVVAHDLKRKEPQDVAEDDNHGHTRNDELTFLQIIVAHGVLLFGSPDTRRGLPAGNNVRLCPSACCRAPPRRRW